MSQRIRCLLAVGVVLLAGSLVGCDKTIVGTGRYVPDAPSTNLPLVKIDALPSLLPTGAEAAATLKSPPLALAGVYDAMPPEKGVVVSDPNCLGVFGIDESVYRGSDYQGVFGQLIGDPSQNGVRVDQGVVAFSSAEEAQNLVDAETRAWKSCTGHPLTLTIDDQVVTWTASGPTASDGVSVLLRTQQGESFV
jgi:hypothetical protein